MPEPLDVALARLEPMLLDLNALVRAVGAGRRRGHSAQYERVELRPVDLRAGRRLQIVTTDGRTPTTRNHPPGAQAQAAVEELLAEPFGNWHVETTDYVVQLRVTKKGLAQVHTTATSRRQIQSRTPTLLHDRVKERLLDPGDPLFAALGAQADKRRQVEAFLRQLAPVVARARAGADAQGRPLHVVDLGCGNAYLTFAAHRYLAQSGPVRTVGIDQRPELVDRNNGLAVELDLAGGLDLAGELGAGSSLRFVAGSIDTADPQVGDVDVVLALHACDTATDDALAQAVRWHASVVLAAPCCHHDVQRQLGLAQSAGSPPPAPYAGLTRHAILRERFADLLTDTFRAQVLRLLGYRVDVVEFVDSRHTPRNALLRAVRTQARPDDDHRRELAQLAAAWHVEPALTRLLAAELAAR